MRRRWRGAHDRCRRRRADLGSSPQPSPAEPVATAIVLDYYGQIRGDACARLARGDDSLADGAPAGATSPLNAGPPAPEDERARPALDQLPVPANWPLIDERTTSSMDEPWAHGIQRTWCIPATATTSEIEAVLNWAHTHETLLGEAGVPVLLDVYAYPDAWTMLGAQARLHLSDARSLDIAIHWSRNALPPTSGSSEPTSDDADIRLHLACAPRPQLDVESDSRSHRTPPASAAAICAAIDADLGLLDNSATRTDCRASAYPQLVADIRGTWESRPIAVHRESCDAARPSLTRRWISAVGLDGRPTR